MRIGLSIGVEGSSRRRSRGERRGNSNNLPGGEKGSDSYESHDASPSSGCVCLPACEFFFCFQFLCVCVCFKLLRRCRGHKSPCPYLRPLGGGGGGGFRPPNNLARKEKKPARQHVASRAYIYKLPRLGRLLPQLLCFGVGYIHESTRDARGRELRLLLQRRQRGAS